MQEVSKTGDDSIFAARNTRDEPVKPNWEPNLSMYSLLGLERLY